MAAAVEDASLQRNALMGYVRPIQKITFAEMRDSGVRGILVYCASYRCSHSIASSADAWPDELRWSSPYAKR